jgi:DNA oxidative demethylase
MTSTQMNLLPSDSEYQALADGLLLLPGHAATAALRQTIDALTAVSPLRQMTVPFRSQTGGRMAVAMSNCGSLGWTSDARGYRYTAIDPLTQKPWPSMPALFVALAKDAAARAGYLAFEPDVCLINRYLMGTPLGLHRDSDEADHNQPIVSVSIGASAQFLWGGLKRKDPIKKLWLHDGDVLVWGGPARLTYHGVAPLRHADPQAVRFNLTFRRAA